MNIRIFLLPIVVIAVSSLARAESTEPSEGTLSTTTESVSSGERWGVGLSFAFDTFGVKLMHKLSDTWGLEAEGEYGRRKSFGGANPNAQVPYGLEVDQNEKMRASLLVTKSFALNDARTWHFVGGSGMVYQQTSQQARFYNQLWGGNFYDRATVVGTERAEQRQFIIPAVVGIRRTDVRFLNSQLVVGALLALPLTGKSATPEYHAPNGQTVLGDDLDTQYAALKLEAGLLF